ncbi:hypothetical protein C8034_v004009 [Colletotrichum sidae]|uniref:Uncharacterized protein n=1 Tax=Colletotrichum sidae TaxID=1347389 RepID=A0A4R8T7D7_9PEZI|nr:hypothetical protein C8034_v004009 [Colletotrichum sidae]
MRAIYLLILLVSLLGASAGVLKDKGYILLKTGNEYDVYSGHFDDEMAVNTVAFDPDGKSMTITRAYNGWETAHPGKMRLSEVLGALADEAAVVPDAMDWVVVASCMNDETLAALMKYVRKHRIANPSQVTVSRGDAEWDEFAATPFVKAVNRFLNTKSVGAFVAKKSKSGIFPDIHLSLTRSHEEEKSGKDVTENTTSGASREGLESQ